MGYESELLGEMALIESFLRSATAAVMTVTRLSFFSCNGLLQTSASNLILIRHNAITDIARRDSPSGRLKEIGNRGSASGCGRRFDFRLSFAIH